MTFVARLWNGVFLSNYAHSFFGAKNAQPIAVRFPEFRVESGDQFAIVHHFPGLGIRGCWDAIAKGIGGLFALKKIEPCAQVCRLSGLCRLRCQRGNSQIPRGTSVTKLSGELDEYLRSQ